MSDTHKHVKRTLKNRHKASVGNSGLDIVKEHSQRKNNDKKKKTTIEAQKYRWTVIKTDTQIHREKYNTLATKATQEPIGRGIHRDTHIDTSLPKTFS